MVFFMKEQIIRAGAPHVGRPFSLNDQRIFFATHPHRRQEYIRAKRAMLKMGYEAQKDTRAMMDDLLAHVRFLIEGMRQAMPPPLFIAGKDGQPIGDARPKEKKSVESTREWHA